MSTATKFVAPVKERVEAAIEKARRKAGMTRAAFFHQIPKLDKRTARKMEKGEEVAYASVHLLAEKCGVTYKFLVGDDSPDEAPPATKSSTSANATIYFRVREDGERDDPIGSAVVTLEGKEVFVAQTNSSGRCEFRFPREHLSRPLKYSIEKAGFDSGHGTFDGPLPTNDDPFPTNYSVDYRLQRLTQPDHAAIQYDVVRLLTRFLDGLRYYAIFRRGSGQPVMTMESETVDLPTLWAHSARVIEQLDCIEQASGLTSFAFAAGLEIGRAFVIPLEGFVFVGVFEEKFGDVFWHTYWERNSAEMSLTQVLRPLAGLRTLAAPPVLDQAAGTRIPGFLVKKGKLGKKGNLDANGVSLFEFGPATGDAIVKGDFQISPVDIGHYALLADATSEFCGFLADTGIVPSAGWREAVITGMEAANPVTVLTKTTDGRYSGLRGRVSLGAAVDAVRAVRMGRKPYLPVPITQGNGLGKLRGTIRSLASLQVCYLPEKLVWTSAHMQKSSDDLVIPDIFGALWEDAKSACGSLRTVVGAPHTLFLELPSDHPTVYFSHLLSDELALIVGATQTREVLFSELVEAIPHILADFALDQQVFLPGEVFFDSSDGVCERFLKMTGKCNHLCSPISIQDITKPHWPDKELVPPTDKYRLLRAQLEKLANRGNIIVRELTKNRFRTYSRLVVIGTAGLLGAMISVSNQVARLTIAAASGHGVGKFSDWLAD
jgi:hypothetical protein